MGDNTITWTSPSQEVNLTMPAGYAGPAQTTAGPHGDEGFYAILGGVIITVILVLTCLVIVLLRYMYRHKGSYFTNEAKGTEYAETADTALKGDPSLQEATDESKKEYFI
ncbi:glycophorin-C-like [Paramormyrops kingsleyae]|uniref:Glycophorin C (Gerbich blood group) n=1 Tax=Paramormyrops kingsleyae TaxID=1676925 RepID=A0A3B3S525_9TELE|nr:glycophorin-C-like [Paramormyrops kingsleyae]